MLHKFIVWFAIGLVYCNTVAAADYGLHYNLDLSDAPKPARVTLKVVQTDGLLRELRVPADDPRFTDIEAKKGLTRSGDDYVWSVPEKGGTLSWRAPITHARDDGELDARLGKHWALFRGEDAFPSMGSRAIKGAESAATLTVEAPDDWSFVTAWPSEEDGYRIANPERRFDRPTGWMIAGAIGVRIDRIAGVRASVAAPKDERVRRQDIMALLNWSLPDLVRLLPDYPTDLLIVSADDPFWRGGLSGPASLYLHAQRPLISENGTSTPIHELFHVGFRRSGGKRDDWIIEGLAEFYSVQILRRSGTVTASRHAKTMRGLERWARKARDKPLRGKRSSGATTARAVLVFAALDDEIRGHNAERSLDDVVRKLAKKSGPVDLDELRDTVKKTTGLTSKVLADIGE